MRVKATREGLPGAMTASGYKIEATIPFVALPGRAVLHRVVKVSNPATGKSCTAIVLDVGPWNTKDYAYLIRRERPQAESGTDMFGRPTNGAGIDLGEAVWVALGMIDNGPVDWDFI